MKGRKVLITGSSGYLGQQLIENLAETPLIEKIIGFDLREPKSYPDKFCFIKGSILDRNFGEVVLAERPDTLVHGAWTFNPTHDLLLQDCVDLGGTLNVLYAAIKGGVKNFFYTGSTTCYGALPENPSEEPFLKEEDWVRHSAGRMSTAYRYARNKALVDLLFQLLQYPSGCLMDIFWIRGAIVVGPHTNNVVSHLARSPFTFGKFMFRVAGYDPPMQFISEHDMSEILYRAVRDRWGGVVNVAGDGTVKYSEVVRVLGRREICLPAWLLYPVTEILWKLGIFKFPSSLIDLVRYPWVADTTKLKKEYGYQPLHTSREALVQLAGSL
ncbi:MAG: hypothetical protein A3C71_02970 [Candidatus Yanofskybacteria bacterium RIFCSPHIGHO2_02_FULL_43_15c]|uniref:NAD-dependent epimerase/dehydratase domain-containing protein n=1 Tax=Candidatus Yanofskybacteria bacterium RIFCSPHIGHO2_02_FULL_43_15c TaxID=1802679 RepID=A0A1F8FEX2_9BACT|nr:MAG: hypothetical protein A3C71_02970 [Candidatus Yanofskybacteria bacterium RIFCSPHIGHO2_02_FULL_43_15c]